MNKKNSDQSNNPADQAAKHLANLMGRPVAGFNPEYTEDPEAEALIRSMLDGTATIPPLEINGKHQWWDENNANWIVVAGYINGDEDTKKFIQDNINSDYLSNELAKRMFIGIPGLWNATPEEVKHILTQVAEDIVKPLVSTRILLGFVTTWARVKNFAPNEAILQKAIDLLKDLKEGNNAQRQHLP